MLRLFASAWRTLATLLVVALAAPSLAAPGGLPANIAHTDSSPEWDRLRAQLFKEQPIEVAASKVELQVPLRAAYGAAVPVKVVSRIPQKPELYVKRMYVAVDKNPSQLAAVFDLTTELGQADFEMRLRVDEYSHIRVVAELSDGTLHMASRYVKTSGGCSAPPNRSPLSEVGRTAFKLPEGVKMNGLTAADLRVTHPNDTGFELNNQTVMFIPPHFVRSIKVRYGERKLFDAELDFSISENPQFRFNFVPQAPAELKAEVEDSKELRYQGSLAVR
ncbi:MAG TPA: quinoprotein dehydrogenase-associated SoxYZ-like carrier [Methylibium sp.]|nr:quinoprotein dehydrogenase-associated SoxYZ-like carrier [Methylibium sp.]